MAAPCHPLPVPPPPWGVAAATAPLLLSLYPLFPSRSPPPIHRLHYLLPFLIPAAPLKYTHGLSPYRRHGAIPISWSTMSPSPPTSPPTRSSSRPQHRVHRLDGDIHGGDGVLHDEGQLRLLDGAPFSTSLLDDLTYGYHPAAQRTSLRRLDLVQIHGIGKMTDFISDFRTTDGIGTPQGQRQIWVCLALVIIETYQLSRRDT